jgi:hypothetical protein
MNERISVGHSLPIFEVPGDTLPSKSLPYPKNSTISYYPYTYGEIMKISQSIAGIKLSYQAILEGIVTSFPKEDLTLQDFLYIALARKLTTLGKGQFSVPYVCPKCMQRSTAILDLDKVDLRDIEAADLPVVATFSKGEYHFKPLTVGQFFELVDKGLTGDSRAYLAMMCCNKEFEEAYEYFNTCSFDDGKIQQKVDRKLGHGIRSMENKCSNLVEVEGKEKKTRCKEVTKVNVAGVDVIVRPFREGKEPSDDVLRFGV